MVLFLTIVCARAETKRKQRSASMCEIQSAKESLCLTIVSSLEIVSFWIQTDSFKHVMIFVRLKKQGTPQRRPEFGRLNGTRAFFLRECFDDVLFAFVLLVLWTRINAQRRPLGSNFFEFSPPFPPSETFSSTSSLSFSRCER